MITAAATSTVAAKNNTGEKGYCPICRIVYDFSDAEKRCDSTQFNFDELCKRADEFFPYLEEYFEVMDSYTLLELLNHGQFSSYYRENYTGTKHITSLEEMIQATTEMKISNGEDYYLKARYE